MIHHPDLLRRVGEQRLAHLRHDATRRAIIRSMPRTPVIPALLASASDRLGWLFRQRPPAATVAPATCCCPA
jgi:hypothetical protein